MKYTPRTAAHVLLVLLAFMSASAAVAGDVWAQVGGDRIGIPSPAGMVSAEVSPPVAALFAAVISPKNRLLAAFVPPDEVAGVARGALAGFSRHFRVEVVRAIEATAVAPIEWQQLKTFVRAQSPRSEERPLTADRQGMSSANKQWRDATGDPNITLGVAGVRSLGIVDESQDSVTLGWAVRGSVTTTTGTESVNTTRLLTYARIGKRVLLLEASRLGGGEAGGDALLREVRAWLAALQATNAATAAGPEVRSQGAAVSQRDAAWPVLPSYNADPKGSLAGVGAAALAANIEQNKALASTAESDAQTAAVMASQTARTSAGLKRSFLDDLRGPPSKGLPLDPLVAAATGIAVLAAASYLLVRRRQARKLASYYGNRHEPEFNRTELGSIEPLSRSRIDNAAPTKAPAWTGQDEAEALSGKLVVNGYRQHARSADSAPSARTTDMRILEIYRTVLSTFRAAASRRGQILPAGTLNFIAWKFMQVDEMMGPAMTDKHLAYEVSKYERDGLRSDYDRDLKLF